MIFAIMSLVFTKHAETSAIAQKADILMNNVARINEISQMAHDNPSTNMDIIYRNVIDNISYNLDASIIIFDTNGKIVTVSGLSKRRFLGKNLAQEFYSPVINGKEINGVGILDKIYDNESMLTVGAPLKKRGAVFGGVFLSQPVPDIKGTYKDMFKELIIILVVAMLITMLLFFVISKRITDPINHMSKVVKEFAKGNFSNRVEYSEDDEIGSLASNINNMATSLSNLESMRSRFVSDVSHELRTPMTTISGFAQGLLDGTIDESEREKYLGIVLSESKRLSKLVTDLLALTKAENGQMELTMTDFDICDLVCQTLFKFELQIEEKNIEIELNIPDEKCFVNADKNAITQVLINLINNAVKFVPDNGKISFRIWTYQQRTYVEIKNTGEGIEKDKLTYIWDRFYKTDSSRSLDPSGFGLGLYIVKSIISNHDEKIWADSVVGEYTSFTFSIKKSK